MSDDHSQRPYRSNDTIARGAPAKAPGSPSGSDPLAELARLIGQNDPFAEFGRDGGRRPAAPPTADWPAEPAAPENRAAAALPPMPEEQTYATPNFARQSFGGAPLAAGGELYQVENGVPGYATADEPGYADEAYHQSKPQLGAEQEDFYDEVPPPRRRMGVMVIAGVFALAVIGTAGAFGYRALFGSSGSNLPPPVIKADSAPSKIVPASSKDAQSSKQITDRVNERGLGEKLVSREEQPVEIKDKPAGVIMPPGQDAAQSATRPPLGSGVVGSEPKKVRTIAIRPDQAATADTIPASAPPAAATEAPARVTTVTPAKQAAPAQPARVINNPPPAADPDSETAPASRQPVARSAPTVQETAAPAPSNAPLSLSPNAPARAAPARAAAPAKRTAAVASTQTAPAATSGAGGYAVQVSSQRSEADAQAAFRSLQGKYPGQLGGKQALIHKVDLGEKGTYYRAMVGPFGNANEASALCSSLKAAGGQCIVQRN